MSEYRCQLLSTLTSGEVSLCWGLVQCVAGRGRWGGASGPGDTAQGVVDAVVRPIKGCLDFVLWEDLGRVNVGVVQVSRWPDILQFLYEQATSEA